MCTIRYESKRPLQVDIGPAYVSLRCRVEKFQFQDNSKPMSSIC